MRQSNLELCRIASIVLILLLHSDFAVFGTPEKLSDTSLLLLVLESFAVVGVNVFVLLTGYFSATPKKGSLINLLYICFFYGTIKIIFHVISGPPLTISKLLFVSNSNWFVPAYLGLLLFTPALNSMCEKLTQKQLLGGVLLMLGYEIYMGLYPAIWANVAGFNLGYSVMSFMVLYVIARYISLYGIHRYIEKYSFTLYIVSSLLLAGVSYSTLAMNIDKMKFMFAYANPLIIFSSVCFFITFEKIEIGVNKVINYVAKSVLAVLIVHTSAEVFPFIKSQYLYLYSHYSGFGLIAFWILSIVVTFVFSLLLDQLRILSYNQILKLKK